MPHLLGTLIGSVGPIVDGLIRASVAGTVFVGIVWACCKLVPRLSAAVRCGLWWCAALKLVLDLVWVAPIPVPILPAVDRVPAAPIVTQSGALAYATGVAVGAGTQGVSVGADRYGLLTKARPAELMTFVLALWLTGVLVALGLTIRRYRRTFTVISRSATLAAADAEVADLSVRLSLARPPRICLSDDINTPLVAGIIRPVVLLPAGFSALSDGEQRMVLCHELAHVKRADLWLGCVPALAEVLFFFHPLAHVAAREYGLWREAACDAVVLRTLDAAPQAYGRLLLNLGVARPGAGLAAAGASWSFSILKRRITMLRDPSTMPSNSRLVAGALVGLAVLALVPIQIIARAPEPAAATSSVESTPPSAAADSVGERAGAQAGPVPAAQESTKPRREQELAYVLFLDERGRDTMMSGSLGDIDRARRLRRTGERLLWFRHRGKEYVVRDAALLRQVVDIWQAVHEIGEQQGKLGSQQGELGAKQGQIGARQGELGSKQGELGAKQGELGARQAVLGARESSRRLTEAGRSKIEQEQKAIEEQMNALGRQMDELEAKMAESEKPMRDLEDQMDVLGNQMDVLGRKMDEASAKAESQMRTLIERAITGGLAQEVK